MTEDPEITAMAKLKDVLAPLDDETREHVIRWAVERFGLAAGRRAGGLGGGLLPDLEHEQLGSFFSGVNPSTDAEKALTVGYWLQAVGGHENFDGGSVNTELKNLGHGVKNITRAFDDLKARRPALAIQVQKSGRAKQARKKYKITEAGLAKVRAMLEGEESPTQADGSS